MYFIAYIMIHKKYKINLKKENLVERVQDRGNIMNYYVNFITNK